MTLAADFYTQVMREIVTALGAALFAANAYALVRRRGDRRRSDRVREARVRAKAAGARVEEPEQLDQAPVGRSLLFMLVGLLVMIWGIASMVTA